MKANFALNTRSEPQRCVLVPPLIFSHSLKQTIILTFDKLCINLIEFDHFATDFAKNISLDGQSNNQSIRHSLRENVNLSQSLNKLIQDCIICIIMYLSLTNQNT